MQCASIIKYSSIQCTQQQCRCVHNARLSVLQKGKANLGRAGRVLSGAAHNSTTCGHMWGVCQEANEYAVGALQEVDVSTSNVLRQALQQATGQRTVPQV